MCGVPSVSVPVIFLDPLLGCCASQVGLTEGLAHPLSLSSSRTCRSSQHFLRGHLTEGNGGLKFDVQTATLSRMH